MKLSKKLLSLLLCAVMVLGSVAIGGNGFAEVFETFSLKASAYSTGDYIYYGTYPQSEVTDNALVSALNSVGGTWQSYGYYSGTGDPNDGQMKPSDYMRYKDVSYNGSKYRAVTFDSYRPRCTGYTSSTSNTYQDDNGYTTGNVYWFKYEPITWRVLDPATGMVMADTILDSQAFNNFVLFSETDETDGNVYFGDSAKTYYANNYEKSSIREWLNSDFYNTAFSTDEQNKIEFTSLENSAHNESLSEYGSDTTCDKIYLLSRSDVINNKYGFSSNTGTKDDSRQVVGSDYAKCQGLQEATFSKYSYWVLRSPGLNSCYSYCVGNDGKVTSNHDTYFTCQGIRPALNLNLNSDDFNSVDKNSGKDSDNEQSKNEDAFFDGILGLIRKIFYSRVSFDTDGGTQISNIYAFKFFGKIKKPADPEKEGYTFDGWDQEIPTRAPFSNKTIKAKWIPNKYTITFLANNGEFSDGSVKKEYVVEYGNEITAPDDVERKTYSFTGWGPRVISPINGDATYEAQWYKNTSYVYANGNDEFVSATADLVEESLKDENFDSANAAEDEFYFGRLIVRADDYKGIDFEELEADKVIYGDDGLAILQFSSSELAEKCAEYLNSLSKVDYVEADAFVDVPTDVEVEEMPTVTGKNWGKSYIYADKYAYYLEQNNFNDMMTVAVIDSGVDTDHPCLNGRVMASSYNSICDNSEINDNVGHGTHVAGIIVDCTSNLSNIKIVAVKALDTNGGSILSIVNAINYASDINVDVINLSLEGKYNNTSKYIERAIENARAKGITVVVAAGNGDKDNNNSPVDTQGVCPAYLDSAIVVGALKEDGDIAYFSNYGKSVDVCAPGWAVYSGTLDGKYAYLSGTSQAAPHISAVAVMYKLSHPDYSPGQIESLIKQYCVDKGAAGRDDFCGEGCPDMYNAIPDCTVSFNSNGGSSVSAKTTKNSSTVVLPKPTKSYKITLNANGGSVQTSTYTRNCTFNGWYTTSSLSGESYTANESYMLLKSQTLYAKWTSGTLGSVNPPTRDYYTFSGWYDKASGGTYYSTSKQISSNITLYAHWTLNPEQGWSDSVPSGAKSTQTRTVYRYRTRSVSPINTIKTQYQYGYYACSKCGRRWYGPCNCSALGGSCSGYISGPYLAWFDFSPNTGNWKVRTGDGTVWSIDIGSGDYFYTSNSSTVLYQYMTTRQVSEQTGTSYGAWSSWSSWSGTNPGNASNTKEVQSKVQYMYRYK